MFRNALNVADFDVLEASDGYAALALVEQHHPNVVVLDLGLPTVSGHVVLQELAARAHTRDIPVVVVTAEPSAVETAAMACLLRKPVDPYTLVQKVRACLASSSPSPT
jgi:DNA-binding response OmpR family regulator